MVAVIYVKKKDAKKAKTELESLNLLNTDYRLTSASNDLIAVPIRQDASSVDRLTVRVHGQGDQECPYSTAKLGNFSMASSTELSPVQSALLQALLVSGNNTEAELLQRIKGLHQKTCPRKLELFGDDRTVVIPRQAFRIELNTNFRQLLSDCALELKDLWPSLATSFRSHRIVRRDEIDPDSGTRKSRFSLLWYCEKQYPVHPTWITVTENGIRQSFDLTRVMFSRGNVTEKRRFGHELVQPNERVLDMYAGIGYFTLPALIHGKARHVTCLEWNPDAVEALRYNLKDNNVAERATIHVGDCRTQSLESHYDRISLGLLPSSEGGWSTAMKALSPEGGWLHIHGNVPICEVESWAQWIAWTLQNLTPLSVVVHHVEKVKSFAPKIWHSVADVKVGPGRGEAAVLVDGLLVVCGSTVHPPSCALSSSGILHQSWMMGDLSP